MEPCSQPAGKFVSVSTKCSSKCTLGICTQLHVRDTFLLLLAVSMKNMIAHDRMLLFLFSDQTFDEFSVQKIKNIS